MIAPQFKHFQKLRDFIEMKLPPGFPVKVDIPVSKHITFKLNFTLFYTNIFSKFMFILGFANCIGSRHLSRFWMERDWHRQSAVGRPIQCAHRLHWGSLPLSRLVEFGTFRPNFGVFELQQLVQLSAWISRFLCVRKDMPTLYHVHQWGWNKQSF